MRNISLYVHIPFCKRKCYYCDFPSQCGMEKLMNPYVNALRKEIETLKEYTVKTIYVGGGTPTYLNTKLLKEILESINELKLDPNIEYSIECNPGTCDFEKFEMLKSMGVNRISFGLQSTDDSILKSIGRIHTFDEFLKSLELARKAGFENINADLIFGLPMQNVSGFKNTLETVSKLNLQHISCYGLIVEKGTVFYKLYENNRLNLPDEDEEREMYKSTIDILKEYGYYQYEISNFSKSGYECIHNLTYWNLNEYIGVGSSAASYIDGFMTKNEASISKYIRRIENGEAHPYSEKHLNAYEENIEEFVFMGMRKINGISKIEFSRRFNKKIEDIYGKQLKKYIKTGFIIDAGDTLRLSPHGIEVSNYILSDFILRTN